MATVEKGLMTPHTDMQQSSSVNSTLNFMPGAMPSWSGAAPQHDSYGAIWEPTSSTTTSQPGQGQGQGNMSCINLMGRMAYVDHNTGTFNIMEGNMNWMAAKYHNTNDSINHNNMNSNPKANLNLSCHHNLNIGGNQEMSYLDPLSPREQEGVSSSCVLQAQEDGSLMTKTALLKRHGVVDPHESPLLKKQRSSSPSPKETSSKEDPGTSNDNSEVGPALNTNGRPRAKRGSATDPQSVYARQRRERINERLKILQNLVPNGAKVDIVTMLEEAISYVKFLQLQVKLLSSDEYWMYAPTTYNGIDVSFDMLQHSS